MVAGAALSSWKAGAESCSIWGRVRAMLTEGRHEAALHMMALHMLDEPQSRSKLSAEEQKVRQLSWWVLAKAVAGQLGAREALALVEKGHVAVQRNGAVAECFKELQRRPLLPEPEPEQRLAPSSPQREMPTHNFEGSAAMAAAVLASVLPGADSGSGSGSDDDEDTGGWDEKMRAWLTAAATRQEALGTASVRCSPSLRRHRGLPPGPLPARTLAVLETESGTSAGVALALFAAMGAKIGAAMTEAISRAASGRGEGFWVRPAALQCLTMCEQLAPAVVAVEQSFASTHEAADGLAAIHANVVAAASGGVGMMQKGAAAVVERVGPTLVEELARERRRVGS